ncbi:MAG: hypothetical protein FD155_620 [Bacteroidetes bacterium]|nr:MAG: hypothetical protein FD155_620 [Bacteroidota bacterium]
MRQSIGLTGSHSELALRFPNVLAFLVYAIAVWLLLKPWKNNPFLYFLGLGMLLLNPYLIDFFSIARGYGLALAFGLMAVYFFVKAREPGQLKPFVRDLFFSMLFSLLAAYSNFIFINLNIALLALFLLEFVLHYRKEILRENLSLGIGLILIVGLNLHHINKIHDILMVLQDNKELYFGGKQGFIISTLRVLIHRSIYLGYYGEAFWERIYHGLIIAFFGLTVILLLRKKQSGLNRIFALLVVMIAAAVIQFHVFQILFPVDRTALIFIPLAGLTLFHVGVDLSDWFSSHLRKSEWFIGLVLFAFFVLPMGYHFIRNMNTKYILEWKFDANTKEVVRMIQSESSSVEQKSIVSSWEFHPALDFYIQRISNNKKLIIDNTLSNNGDYIYCHAHEKEKIADTTAFTVMANFADTKTILLKRKNPHPEE